MRCALDATPLLGARTGVAVFTMGALSALAARPDVEVSAYALSWRGRSMLREVLPPGITSGWSVPAGPLLRLWSRSDLLVAERILDLDEDPDVVHGTNFVVPPTRAAARVVTVHDLTAVRFPEMTSAVSRRYPPLVRRAVERGAFVHTPSAYVAAEVCEIFGASPERVRVVPHGVDPSPVIRRPGQAPYVLAVGTLEPRKDLALLVRAFDQIAGDHEDLKLVLAGGTGWGRAELDAAIATAEHRARIEVTGYVSDDDRLALLAGATVFAYPSRYEGFGLPPLEAMAAGVPVVATAAGAVPEICGDAASIVDVGDTDAFAAALDEVLSGRRLDLVARGKARAATFTWDRCASGLVELYEDAVSG